MLRKVAANLKLKGIRLCAKPQNAMVFYFFFISLDAETKSAFYAQIRNKKPIAGVRIIFLLFLSDSKAVYKINHADSKEGYRKKSTYCLKNGKNFHSYTYEIKITKISWRYYFFKFLTGHFLVWNFGIRAIFLVMQLFLVIMCPMFCIFPKYFFPLNECMWV